MQKLLSTVTLLAAILLVCCSPTPPAYAATPDHLELNTATSVQLTPDQPEAILTVDLPEPGKVSMTFDTYFPNAQYTVLSGDRRVIEPHIRFDGTPDKADTGKHETYLEKGTYAVVLDSTRPWQADDLPRDFTVTFDFKPSGTAESEPNETLDTAVLLPPNSGTLRGLLSWSDRSDLYKLVVPKAGSVSLDYVTDAEDTRLVLMDAAGQELYIHRCEQEPDGKSRPYNVTTHLEAGTYYVNVRSEGLTAYRGGLYSLHSSFTPVSTDDQEPNNDTATAQPLPLGKWTTGLLSYTDRADFYKLTLTAPMHIRLHFDFAIPRYEVQIHTASGRPVYNTNEAFDRDETPGKFTKELKLEPDTYYVKLRGPYAPDETGIYRLFAEDLALTKQFDDVSPAYKEGVDYLVRNKITNGLTSSTFGVTQKLKRADAAVLLAKALGLDTDIPAAVPFKDVPSRASGAIQALKERRIMNGKSPDRFGADDPLTRGEVALILDRAYNLNGIGLVNPFEDVPPMYETAVNAMVKYNITKGKSATLFGTANPITRGEIALFLYRASEVKK